jgi:hypothetical protein
MSSLQYNEIFDARKLQYIINNWDSINFSDSEIKDNNEKWQPLSILNNYLIIQNFIRIINILSKLIINKIIKILGAFLLKVLYLFNLYQEK